MAVISTYVEGNYTVNSGIFFTAPFDCIIGVDVKSCSTSGPHYFKNYNGTNEKHALASSVSTGTKISNIIMKAGDKLSTSTGISAYITGVSA